MSATQRTLTQETFRGWPAFALRQENLCLHLVPGVGGRLMGMAFGEQQLCFIHPQLEGKTYSGNEADWPALCGDWSFPLWGGGKTWVAPESAWPQGAPHRDLDSLAWSVTANWCNDTSMGVVLQSPVCRDSGLQITRRLSLCAGDSVWHIEHTLTNCAAQPIDCGLWDVLMLNRPGVVRVPLAQEHNAAGNRLTALPGKPSITELVHDSVIDLSAQTLHIRCAAPREFKCGFFSVDGQMQVDFAAWNIRYSRHSAVSHNTRYAHGHPLEVFNAPSLDYFEIETHSPAQRLLPGDSLRYTIHERVDAL